MGLIRRKLCEMIMGLNIEEWAVNTEVKDKPGDGIYIRTVPTGRVTITIQGKWKNDSR